VDIARKPCIKGEKERKREFIVVVEAIYQFSYQRYHNNRKQSPQTHKEQTL
jgi:hypothetical protein